MKQLILMAALLMSAALGAATQHIQLSVGGQSREAWLDVPDAAGPWPLVLVLHGGGGTAKRMIEFSGFSALGRTEGFAACYPESVSRHWNDGRVDGNAEAAGKAVEGDADDAGFLAALVAKLVADRVADPTRVYLCGISNGGMMSLRMACEYPQLFAAAGVIAASQPTTHPCKSSTPLPIYFFHGTEDPLVPYAGGDVKLVKFGRSRGHVDSVEATVASWAVRDRAGAPVESAFPATDPKDPTRALLHSYGPDLKFCAIQGGGHTWPGGTQYAPEWLIGKTCHSISATALLWDFFKAHRRAA